MNAGLELCFEPGNLGNAAGRHATRAQVRDRFERRTLVLGIGAHSVDELWHEVVTALQLNVNVAPCCGRLIACANEAVEDHDAPEQYDPEGNGDQKARQSRLLLQATSPRVVPSPLDRSCGRP